MVKRVKSITAIGTRGEALGKAFTAKPNNAGQFVLNRKNRSPSGGKPTNYASNKVYVDTLDRAAELLVTDEYLIHLVCGDKRALREFKKVKIELF